MDDPGIEAERLRFDERKWDSESKLRELEVQAKERENSWTGRLFSPLTTTLLAGVVTVAGTAFGTLIQGRSTLQLETKKFEANQQLESEKEQHELILKMVSVGDVDQARKNIRFLAETGLLADKTLAKNILDAKETPVLPRPSGQPGALPSPVIVMTQDEFNRRVSADAINTIVAFETGGRIAYEKNQTHPVAPADFAGIVIGVDYDLGATTENDFRRDWQSHLTAADLDRLAQVIGVRGDDAKGARSRLEDITIRWEDALAVFNVTLAHFASLLDSRLPNTRELPPDCYGALLSLAYNRGTAFTAQGDQFKEMRNIRSLMESKQFGDIPAQIRGMERLSQAAGVTGRREQEAKLFEKGLTPHNIRAQQ